MESVDIFLSKLKAALDHVGATAEFARRSGISRPTIDNWLKRHSVPILSQVDRVAEGLGISTVELIGGISPAEADRIRAELREVNEELETARGIQRQLLDLSRQASDAGLPQADGATALGRVIGAWSRLSQDLRSYIEALSLLSLNESEMRDLRRLVEQARTRLHNEAFKSVVQPIVSPKKDRKA